MDIQVSSNFERLLFEMNGRDGGMTAEQLRALPRHRHAGDRGRPARARAISGTFRAARVRRRRHARRDRARVYAASGRARRPAHGDRHLRRQPPGRRRRPTSGRDTRHGPPGQVPRCGRAGDRRSVPSCRRTSPTCSSGPSARRPLPNDLAAVAEVRALGVERPLTWGRVPDVRTDICSLCVARSGSTGYSGRDLGFPGSHSNDPSPTANRHDPVERGWERRSQGSADHSLDRAQVLASPRSPIPFRCHPHRHGARSTEPHTADRTVRHQYGRGQRDRTSTRTVSSRVEGQGQLIAIAEALGVKASARSKKSEIIDQILDMTGASPRRRRPRRTGGDERRLHRRPPPSSDAPDPHRRRSEHGARRRTGGPVRRAEVAEWELEVGDSDTDGRPTRRRRDGAARRRATATDAGAAATARRRAPSPVRRPSATARAASPAQGQGGQQGQPATMARAATSAAAGAARTASGAGHRTAGRGPRSAARRRAARQPRAGDGRGLPRSPRRGLRLPPRQQLPRQRDDSYVPVKLSRQYGLRKGDHVGGAEPSGGPQREEPGAARDPRRQRRPTRRRRRRPRFEDLTALFPDSSCAWRTRPTRPT